MKRTRTLSGGALLLLVAVVDGCGGAPPSRVGVPRLSAKRVEEPVRIAKGLMIALPVPEDPAPAVAACRSGDAKACARAAQLYFDGWGVPRDMIRVAVYGGLACSATRNYEDCKRCDLAYLARDMRPSRFKTPSVEAYKTNVLERFTESEDFSHCKSVSMHDEWGWAVEVNNICEVNGVSSRGTDTVQAACFDDKNATACRALVMTNNFNFQDDTMSRQLAPFCRQEGELCDLATGNTDEETARFREKACLDHLPFACSDWVSVAAKLGRPFDALTIERLHAQAALHPEDMYSVPLSVGQKPSRNNELPSTGGKTVRQEYPLLATSTFAGDQALFRALTHIAERVRAADCVIPFYDATACSIFALGYDAMREAEYTVPLPEEQEWKERVDVLAWMCTHPPPFDDDKSVVFSTCGMERKRVEGQYKAFLFYQARKGKAP